MTNCDSQEVGAQHNHISDHVLHGENQYSDQPLNASSLVLSSATETRDFGEMLWPRMRGPCTTRLVSDLLGTQLWACHEMPTTKKCSKNTAPYSFETSCHNLGHKSKLHRTLVRANTELQEAVWPYTSRGIEEKA